MQVTEKNIIILKKKGSDEREREREWQREKKNPTKYGRLRRNLELGESCQMSSDAEMKVKK